MPDFGTILAFLELAVKNSQCETGPRQQTVRSVNNNEFEAGTNQNQIAVRRRATNFTEGHAQNTTCKEAAGFSPKTLQI